MSADSRKRKQPGRGLAALLAVAAVAAMVAGGIGWAQTGKGAAGDTRKADAKKEARQQVHQQAGTETAKPAGTQAQPVTRSVGSMQVAIDPATGRLQPPTPEEAQQLALALEHMLSQDTDALQVVQLPDGSLMVDLQDTFQDVAMATKDARGKVTLHCVNQQAQAQAILAGTFRAPEAKGPGAKKADRKSGNAALEKE
jgi:hypothetical protein